jgi:hypothetical protein
VRPKKSKRNKYFGPNWWIADGLFPDDLKDKLDAGATTFDKNEYWHLVRLYERTLKYKAPMYTIFVLLLALLVTGVFLGHFGILQSFLALVGLYAVIAAVVQFKNANKVLTPIIQEGRAKGLIDDTESNSQGS